jgi:hypothetical protein
VPRCSAPFDLILVAVTVVTQRMSWLVGLHSLDLIFDLAELFFVERVVTEVYILLELL